MTMCGFLGSVKRGGHTRVTHSAMATLSDMSQTRRELRRQSRFVRFTGVGSEIMLTLGVLSGLFLSWHLVLNDMIRGEAQGQVARDVTQEWNPRLCPKTRLWWKLPLLCPPTVSLHRQFSIPRRSFCVLIRPQVFGGLSPHHRRRRRPRHSLELSHPGYWSLSPIGRVGGDGQLCD